MFGTSITPLSQMSVEEMHVEHSRLAAIHGDVVPVESDRFQLGKRIALLRSTRPPAVAPKRRKKTLTEKRGKTPGQIRRAAIEVELFHVEYYTRNGVVKTPAEWEALTVKERADFHAVGRSYMSIANRLALQGVEVSESHLRCVQCELKVTQSVPTRPIIKKLKPKPE